MKALTALLIMAFLISCRKDKEPNKLNGTFVDELTRRDTIILSKDLFPEGGFSYKPYRWQDSTLSSTYFFLCKSHYKQDTIAVLSMLSSSLTYINAYFRPESGNNAFVIGDFYNWRSQTRSKIRYIRRR